ncbi:hypothetical protein Pcinc_018525 [Petrolisthes cinctipes]|uniref:Uncharacterized protein n=1 Tax=Petrolisthes cinctipes TaxID=88211 RepID=A0AAE1KMD0_PETCI|nr:hypothetical protein Pcinc_018525 [Petrolisthes cinctipes]
MSFRLLPLSSVTPQQSQSRF